MPGGRNVIAMIATTQPDKTRAFYTDILGLSLQEDTPFALVFAAGATMLAWTQQSCHQPPK